MKRLQVIVYGLMIGLAPVSAVGADYYVSPTGSDDAGAGAQASPWKTLAYAASQVPANSTIHLTEGTIVETEISNFPLGTSVIGAGSDKTTLKWAGQTDLYGGAWRFDSEGPVDGNHTISDMTIDGDNVSGFKAINIRYRNNVVIERVVIQNCDKAAMQISGERGPDWPANWYTEPTSFVKGFVLRDSEIYECGRTESYGAGGAILIQVVEGAQIYNCRMINEQKQAYGIKGWDGRGFFKGGKIYNNYFRLAAYTSGAWAGSSFAIELKTPFDDVEVHNNFSYNAFSFVWPHKDSYPKRTVNIHHNTIINSGTEFAIEAALPNAEIAYNYLDNCRVWGIAAWKATKATGADSAASWNRDNLYIHHNIIQNKEVESFQTLVNLAADYAENTRILNNTFVTSASFMFIWGPDNTYRNIDIRNNLLIDVGKMIYVRDATNLEIDGLTIRNNLRVDPEMNTQWWYNFGSATVSTVDTMSASDMLAPSNPLEWSGEKPQQYYMPKSDAGSIIDKGVDVGFPYQGSAPDIGAYEYGDTELTIGADTTHFGQQNPVAVASQQRDRRGTVRQLRGMQQASAKAARFDLRGRRWRGIAALCAGAEIMVDEHGTIRRRVQTRGVRQSEK